MALSPAEKQRRYRARQSALMRSNPDVAERALLEEAARCVCRPSNASLSRTSWRTWQTAICGARKSLRS
jgi:hypothetical protein